MIDPNSILVTPPDRIWRMDPAVLLIGVEPFWIQKIITFLETSTTYYTLYDCQGDMDWGFDVLQWANYMIVNLNNHEEDAMLKGYVLASPAAHWYSKEENDWWQAFNQNELDDPLDFFIMREMDANK